MYIVDCYTRIKGQMYVRGEILPGDLDISPETVEWLKAAGAIHEEAPADCVEEVAPEEEVLDPGDGFPEAEGAEEAEADAEDRQDSEAEAEAPEVDVMAGIVQDDKPTKSGSARGRRKAK